MWEPPPPREVPGLGRTERHILLPAASPRRARAEPGARSQSRGPHPAARVRGSPRPGSVPADSVRPGASGAPGGPGWVHGQRPRRPPGGVLPPRNSPARLRVPPGGESGGPGRTGRRAGADRERSGTGAGPPWRGTRPSCCVTWPRWRSWPRTCWRHGSRCGPASSAPGSPGALPPPVAPTPAVSVPLQIVDLDMKRNRNREALRALQKDPEPEGEAPAGERLRARGTAPCPGKSRPDRLFSFSSSPSPGHGLLRGHVHRAPESQDQGDAAEG